MANTREHAAAAAVGCPPHRSMVLERERGESEGAGTQYIVQLAVVAAASGVIASMQLSTISLG
jgi:hypothetical protein